MPWMAKQAGRVRRFASILPHLFSPPSRIFSELPELGRLVFFNGFEGFKAFCRKIEATANAFTTFDVIWPESAAIDDRRGGAGRASARQIPPPPAM